MQPEQQTALSDTGYFREIQLATDATATLTKTSANRSIANLKRIKFSSVDFSSFTSWIDGASAATSYLWFDDVEFTVGSITTFVAYRSQFARLTNCSISGTDADVYKQFSTARAVMLLEGHSDTSTAVDNNQMNCVFRMVGCEMRQGWVGIHASSPVGSEDRCMYENNKIQINRDSKGFQSNGQIENGLVFAGNILGRRNGAEGSNTLLQIAADSHTLTADNCLVCHNTVLGQRSNVLYDDFTGRTGSCDHQKFVGNLFTFHNQKSDAFNHPTQGQSGDRVSNWAALHGVGYLDNRWDADSGGFRQEYDGINSDYVPAYEQGWANIGDLTFYDDQTDAGGGAGNTGNYLPATGASAEGTLDGGFRLMTYDINGNTIPVDGSGHIGAVQATTVVATSNRSSPNWLTYQHFMMHRKLFNS